MKSAASLACAAIATVAVFAASLGPAQAQRSTLTLSSNTAVLRGLDKITGRASDFNAPVGKPQEFGTLEIVVRACRQAPAEEAPETAVYLEITDRPLQKPDAPPPEPVRVFQGWMYASSPALNALEHPVYDVWAISCKI